MDIRQLRYFAAVAETGHLTRAAERLGLQQPPLSQQIKAIEAKVGVPLFVRHPKGMSLTDAGRQFQVEAQRMLRAFDAMEQRLLRIASGVEGILHVGFTSSAAAHAFTPQTLRACRSEYPGIELVLDENHAAGLTEAVASSRLECGFIRAVVSRPPGLVFETLLKEPAVVALPLDHPLAANSSAARGVSLAQLDGQNMILVRRTGAPGLYANLLHLCAKAGVRPNVVAEVDRMMTNINLVAAGAGLSVVPQSVQGTHAQAVVYRPLARGVKLDAPLTLVYRKNDCSGAIGNFIALVHRLAKARKASA
ncbi:LysR family transcriptional regulator [Piscinibacter terrae]|uniref:LysR family transcriptional regulator n=1 Tax=Piscinibacter terrae TaxID=2496871 RepID=A0A3N7HW23_9BURK|nr:LysR family transcriptional regulator [Albitalea terrae]RQP25191.1 LysR family transcriptional regulator [Albitalea terrae]